MSKRDVPEIPDGWNFPADITQAPATFSRLRSYLRTLIITSQSAQALQVDYRVPRK